MFFALCCISFFLKLSNAVIPRLNDSEYERMPPLYELDNYDRCLRAEGGLYCVIKVTLYASPDNDLMRMIQEYSALQIHYNHTFLERGICVTSKCKQFLTKDIKGEIQDLQQSIDRCFKESFNNDYQLNATVSEIYYCDKSHNKQDYDLGDWLFCIVLLLLIITNVTSTLYDIYLRKLQCTSDQKYGNQYLLSFSIIRNWEQLVSYQNNPDIKKFDLINGLRTMLSFGMVFGHVIFIFFSGFIDNPNDIEAAYQNSLSYIIFNGTLIVQGFFLISGCLLGSKIALNSQMATKWSFIPHIMFNRWCRLTPALALLLGFITTWFRHLGSGPLWNLYVTRVINDCKQHWLSHILYFNNYSIRHNNTCSIQTWHIAADVQMFATTLTLFVVMKDRSRSTVIFMLFMVGCLAPALHDWLQDLNGVFVFYPEFFRTIKDDVFRYVYVAFYNSLSCFAIGLGLAIYTYKDDIKFLRYKRLFNLLTWFVLPMLLLVLMSAAIVYPNSERPSLALRIAYSALHKPLFGGVLFIGLITGIYKIDDTFRPIFEWPGWRVTSRLTYGVFLVHFCIIQYIQGSRKQLFHFSLFNVIIMHLAVVWLSYMIAILLYVLVENPSSKLLNLIISDRTQYKKNN